MVRNIDTGGEQPNIQGPYPKQPLEQEQPVTSKVKKLHKKVQQEQLPVPIGAPTLAHKQKWTGPVTKLVSTVFLPALALHNSTPSHPHKESIPAAQQFKEAEVGIMKSEKHDVDFCVLTRNLEKPNDITVMVVPPHTCIDANKLAELAAKYKYKTLVIVQAYKSYDSAKEHYGKSDDDFRFIYNNLDRLPKSVIATDEELQGLVASHFDVESKSIVVESSVSEITRFTPKTEEKYGKVIVDKELTSIGLKGFGTSIEVNIPSTDGALLNGIEIRPQGLTKTPPNDQKWIVYFNKNAESWERESYMLARLAKDSGANVLCCNYRGVGQSTGFPNSETDLFADGQAVVQYLRKQGVPPENIVVYGSSLGGGVATFVVSERAENGEVMALCNERSFASLSAAVKGFVPVAGSPAASIAAARKWKMKSVKRLQKLHDKGIHVPIIAIFHAKDKMIKTKAGFVGSLEKVKGVNFKKIELHDDDKKEKYLESAHIRLLRSTEQQELVSEIKRILKIR